MYDEKELLMYTRSAGCPFVSIAKRVLQEQNIVYREIFIDMDNAARDRVLEWVGFLSVPTLVVAHKGHDEPFARISPLEPGFSPRGVERGPILTEPTAAQLTAWLTRYGFLSA